MKSFIAILLGVFLLQPLSFAQAESNCETKHYNYSSQNIVLEGGLDQSFTYQSEAQELPEKYPMAGAKLVANNQIDGSLQLSISLSNDSQNWSKSASLPINDSVSDNQIIFDPQILSGSGKYFRYSIISNSDIAISSIEITFIDPGLCPSYNTPKASILSNSFIPDIINRQTWGADESLMNWLSDMEHQPIKYFVVHHTATPESYDGDVSALIRSIYYFHSVERGWGDIGYNYLVDNQGNIYEGRKGGLGVVAAHALGYNYGSIGISLLGDYDQTQPSEAGLKSISKLISYLSWQSDIALDEQYVIKGKDVVSVIGHKDVNDTECPGQALYSHLSSIQTEAAGLLQSAPTKKYDAELINSKSINISLKVGEKKNLSIVYQNTGTVIWQNAIKDVRLVASDSFPRKSIFKNRDWLNNYEVSSVKPFSISPQEQAIFDLPLTGYKYPGTYTEQFSLKDPDNLIPNTEFTLHIEVVEQ